MKYISHIIEPSNLYLCWQGPEKGGRSRYIVGELLRKGEDVAFRYLVESDDFKRASEIGFTNYPAFRKVNSSLIERGVLESFMRRLPPRTRGDFGKYLEQFRIPSDMQISDFALLGYTGAKLPTDGFSIVFPFGEYRKECEFMMEVAGYRYSKSIELDSIRINDPVSIKPDIDNEHDKEAVSIVYKSKKIGYIPRSLLPSFKTWFKEKAKIFVNIERINGSANRPLIYLFVSVKPRGVLSS